MSRTRPSIVRVSAARAGSRWFYAILAALLLPLGNASVAAAADLLVNMTPSPTTVIAGANVTYTIRVDNNAADDAANTELTAVVPAGAQFVSVTPPAGVTCNYPTPGTCALGTVLGGESKTVVLVLRLLTPPSLANTASVTTTSTDVDNSNNTISKTVTVITGADLTATATGAPNPVTAGATVTYTIASQNLGPQSATSITLTNTLPANVTYVSASGTGWSCNPSGQVITCTRPGPAAVGNLPSITIVGRPQVNGTITNTVSITAATADADASNNTSTFDITVNAGADMSVTKTVAPNPVEVGSPVVWSITPRNNGPMAATNITVSDPLPAGQTFVSVSASECSYDGGSNTVTCLFPGPVASGTNLPVIQLTTTATAVGSVSNTVTVGSAVADPNSSNNSATRALTVQAVGSDLSLTKLASPAIQPIGGAVSYTLTARNLGPSPVPAGAVITITDPVPAEMTALTATGSGWTCNIVSNTVTCTRSGPLALNAVTPAITITAQTLTAGVIANTACVTATGTAGDPNAANDCNTAPTTTTATTADVAISQTASPNPVSGGFPLTYTLTVTNNGPDPATSVVVSDALPTAVFVSATPSVGTCSGTSTVTCSLGTLANGASETIVIIIRPLNGPGTRNNTATVSSQIGDPVSANNSSTIPVTITAGVDIQQTVVASPSTVLQGAPMTFVITTRNGGPAQATGVTMTDTLPANIRILSITASQGSCPTAPALNTPLAAASTLACNIGTLNANTQQTVTVIAEPTAVGSGTNSASATSAGAEFDLSNNSASAAYTVTPPQMDLSVIKIDTIDPVAVNTDFQYAITITNNGPSRANNVVLTENTPPQFTYVGITTSKGSCAGTAPIVCSIDTMAAGEVVTLTLTMTASTIGSYVNNAAVAATEPDTNPLNDTTNEQTTAKQAADLAITKTGTPNPVRLNENITFLLTVSNNGPAMSVITTVSDTLPAGVSFVSAVPSQGTCGSGSPLSCAIGTLTSGSSATVTVVARAIAVGGFTNITSVTGSEPDVIPGNNTASFPFTVAPIPDLTITKTHTGSFPRGGAGTFDIGVQNVGGAPTDGTTITVSDTLPAGYTPTAAAGAGWSCSVAAPTVTCTRTDVLNNGASFPSIAVTVAVANNAAASITNTATVAGGGDNTPGNNSASDTVTNVLSLDLTITNTNNLTALQAGQSTTYAIVVSNLGPGDGSGSTVSSVPPVVLTGVTWTCVASGGAVCPAVSGSGAISGTVPTFPSGGVLTYSLTATVLSTATGTVVLPASVTAPAGATDPTPANNTATDTDPLTPTADLSITKTSAPTAYVAGSPLTYTIVVTNAGPVDVTGATVSDTVPAPLGAFTWSCTSPSGACGTGTGNIAATVTLNVGQSATITLTGTVPNGTTGAIVNAATVAPSGGITDPNPSNNTATNTNYASGTLADVQITNTDGVTTVVAGGVTTYTVVVTNAGPSAVTGALVTDVAPAGLTFGTYTCVASAGSSCPASGSGNLAVSIDLLVGGTATFTIPATVSYTAASPLTTTATVALPAGMTDPTPGNNIATDVDTITPPASPVADLSVTKTDGVTSVSAGASTVYTIVATNNGPNAANNSTLVDAVVAGLTKTAVTCSAAGGAVCPAGLTVSQLEGGVPIATWPSGGSLTLTVTATVTVPNGSVTNVASVAVPTGIIDPNLANNTATDVDTVTPPAATDLTIYINDGQTEILPGQALTYTIPVTNLGPGAVAGALVQSVAPAGVTFGNWTCVASAGSICAASGSGNLSTTATLLAGGTLTYRIAATVSATATGRLATTATVTPPAGVVDPTPANNTATDVDVIAPQRIDVEKRAGTPMVVGPATFEIPYTVTVTNAGRVPATNVQVSDSLSAVFTAGNPALTIAVPVTASPTGGASTAQCVANTAFTGLGAFETSPTNLLTGSATLSGSQGCSIAFTVRVAYENAAAVPRQPQVNRAEGYSSTAFAGSHASSDDGSADVVLRLPRVDITKALTGVTQLGDDPAFDVSYTLVVRNTGEVPATNVQVADDLARVFAAGSPTITLPTAPAFGDGDAPLTMAGDFNGTSKTALLSGSDTIAPNTMRTIRLTLRVRYASTLQIPVNQDIVNSAQATTSVTPGGVVISIDDSTDVTETPADPSAGDVPVATAVRFTPKPRLSITKTASMQVVELGDQVSYAVRVSNLGGPALPATIVTDRLPVGFRYVPGSARLSSGAAAGTPTGAMTATILPDPSGAPGPLLGFSLPAQPTTESVTVTYRLHVGPGALQGTGVNTAEATTLGAGAVRSNVARATVAISGGVFTQDACVIGKVFTDLNGNRIQDENEPGIPGVLVRFEEGTGLVSDSEGKYSYCGLTPTTHVLTVDRQTLPAGARLVTSGNRNAGDANSLFVDLKYGEVHRADFIEASGDPQVLAGITERRAQPEVWRPVLESQPLSALPTRGGAGRSLLAVPSSPAPAPNREAFTPILHVAPLDPSTANIGDGAPRALDAEGATVGVIRLSAERGAAPAGSDAPTKLTIRLVDADGRPLSSSVTATIELSDGEVRIPGGRAPDGSQSAAGSDGKAPGTQVRIEGGEATVDLVVQPAVRDLHVRVTAGDASADGSVSFVPAAPPMMAVGIVEGRMALTHLDPTAIEPIRAGAAFERELSQFSRDFSDGQGQVAGRAALFMKGMVKGDYLLTLAYDSEKQGRGVLFRDIQPDAFYPVYGDASLKNFDAQTSGRFYLRAERGRTYLLYGDMQTAGSSAEARNLGVYSRTLTGVQQHFQNRMAMVNLFASRDSLTRVIDEMSGLGTSGPYAVSNANGVWGTEKVEIVTRDRNQPAVILNVETLLRFTDYEYEPFTRRLLLRRPVPSMDDSLNPVSLRVTYEVDRGGEKSWVSGGDTAVNLGRFVQVGGSWAEDRAPQSPYRLRSVNGSVRFGTTTTFVAEAAQSLGTVNTTTFNQSGLFNLAGVSGSVDGTAVRSELRHQSARAKARLFAGTSEAGFNNPSSTLTGGRTEIGGRGSFTLAPPLSVVGEVVHSEDRLVGGRRQGGSVGLNALLSRRLTFEVGMRRATETVTPAQGTSVGTPLFGLDALDGFGLGAGVSTSIDPVTGLPLVNPGYAPQLSAAVSSAPQAPAPLDLLSARSKLTMAFSEALRVYGEAEQDVRDTDKRMLAIGGQFQVAERVRIYLRHEFISSLDGPYALSDRQRRYNTVFGVSSSYRKNSDVFSEYRMRDAMSGREAHAAIGLRNRWPLATGIALSTTVERLHAISGIDQEATAASLGLEYTRNPRLKSTGRVEWRRAPSADSWLSTAGVARKLSRDWTLLSKNYYQRMSPKNGPEQMQDRFWFGGAYRDTTRNRLNLLSRYEFRFENTLGQAVASIGTGTWRKVQAVSTHIDVHPSARWTWEGQHAAKWVDDRTEGLSRVMTQLVSGRVGYDLTHRFDIGGLGSLMWSGVGGRQYAVGGELGALLRDNLWLSFGYNILGFTDRDMIAVGQTSRGGFIRLRMKFDEKLLRSSDGGR